MNGTTRSPVMRTPFIRPHTAPAAIAPAAATSGHDPPRSSCAVTTVLSAMTDPTDRSIPPATITIVMPSAATHTMAVWRAMSSRLAGAEKLRADEKSEKDRDEREPGEHAGILKRACRRSAAREGGSRSRLMLPAPARARSTQMPGAASPRRPRDMTAMRSQSASSSGK